MSDEDVIDTFVGDYENRDERRINNEDPTKLHYYPRQGVRVKVVKVILIGVPGGAYAKIKISNDNGTFQAKLAVERAVFRVVGETLVATDMELEPGLLLTETLTMKVTAEGQKEMEHGLNFSDGKHGTWICEH